MTDFKRQSIKEILGTMADRQSAANHLLDPLKALFRFAMDAEWRTDDPTYQPGRGYKQDGDGFHTWTEDEERHPAGTMARGHCTLPSTLARDGQTRVLMGKARREGNRIRIRQQNTGAFFSIPLPPALAAELDAAPAGDMLYLMTEYGKPHSIKVFGNWFRPAGLTMLGSDVAIDRPN